MSKLPLPSRVEKFLSRVSFLAFAYRDKPAIFSFLFEQPNLIAFNEKSNHEDLRDYFRGRKLKLVIYTSDEVNTTVSLVDIETADSIKIEGPKFVTNNIILFHEAKLPEDTVFVINIGCYYKSPEGEKAMLVNPYWLDKKPLQIHGYSLIDRRSSE